MKIKIPYCAIPKIHKKYFPPPAIFAEKLYLCTQKY